MQFTLGLKIVEISMFADKTFSKRALELVICAVEGFQQDHTKQKVVYCVFVCSGR